MLRRFSLHLDQKGSKGNDNYHRDHRHSLPSEFYTFYIPNMQQPLP